MSLNGKKIVLGITGGIAAYKCGELVRMLVKQGVDVSCVLTKAGSEFITPLTLQTLSKNSVHTEMFDIVADMKIEHISLAQSADLILVAPATANIIAKVACGICDDLLSTVICATKSPVVLAPAMNSNMWMNRITQRNVSTLKEFGYLFIDPAIGELACGDSGPGRMADLEVIVQFASGILAER